MQNDEKPDQVVAEKAKFGWKEAILNAIGVTAAVKIFGPAGGLVACLLFYFVKNKYGTAWAFAASIAAGFAVPFLILAMINK